MSPPTPSRPPEGSLIIGSRFVVGYCNQCDERLRITSDRVGRRNLCGDCKRGGVPPRRLANDEAQRPTPGLRKSDADHERAEAARLMQLVAGDRTDEAMQAVDKLVAATKLPFLSACARIAQEYRRNGRH